MTLQIPLSNIFFWLTLFAVLISLGLYSLNKKTFKLIYAQPILELVDIYAVKEEPDGMGGFRTKPFIRVKITNPSSFATYVSVAIKSSRFAKQILETAYPLNNAEFFDGTYQVIKPFEQNYFQFDLNNEFLSKYLNKELILTVVDIRKKRVNKKFKVVPYRSS